MHCKLHWLRWKLCLSCIIKSHVNENGQCSVGMTTSHGLLLTTFDQSRTGRRSLLYGEVGFLRWVILCFGFPLFSEQSKHKRFTSAAWLYKAQHQVKWSLGSQSRICTVPSVSHNNCTPLFAEQIKDKCGITKKTWKKWHDRAMCGILNVVFMKVMWVLKLGWASWIMA